MLTESAVVIDYKSGIATVQCQAQSACGSCAARKGCGTSLLSDLSGPRGVHTFTVETLMPVKAGQQVQIGLEEKSLIFTALLMYIVPLLTLLITTLIGSYFIQNELIIAGIILMTTALSFVGVRQYASKLNKKPAYKPILLRVL